MSGCLFVCVCLYALRIASTDKTLRFNIFISIIMYACFLKVVLYSFLILFFIIAFKRVMCLFGVLE